MGRNRDLEIDNIPSVFQPSGSNWNVRTQKRIYIRENGKFVGIGYIVTFSRYLRNKGSERDTRIILDEQLQFV